MGRVCGNCKQDKSLKDFNKNSSRPDGLHLWCKECRRKREGHSTWSEERKMKRKMYVKKYNKNMSQAQKELKRLYRTVYNQKHPQIFLFNSKRKYAFIKHGAMKRTISFKLSKEDFCSWYENTPRVCVYCGIKEEQLKDSPLKNYNPKGQLTRLTVDRINSNVGYQLDNLVFACYTCNALKSNVFSFEEMKEIGMKFIKPKNQI